MSECIIKTPHGRLRLQSNGEALTHCQWTNKSTVKSDCPILKSATQELMDYFSKKLKQFTTPLVYEGTAFQKKVWRALLKIPYGETRSYHDIAKIIHCDKAMRAVGSANGKNPLCIFIPCHRVIRATGEIGGYSGGVKYKKTLLHLEAR